MRILKVITFLQIVLMTRYFLSGSASEATSKIILDPQETNFGLFKKNDIKAMKVVYVWNNSNSAINIKRVYASCGCITAEVLDSNLIDTGQSGRIRLILNASHAKSGSHDYPLQVFLNDPNESVIKGNIHYTYAPDIELSSPEFLIYRTADKTHSDSGIGSAVVRIRDNWDKRLQIKSVSSSNPFLEHTVLDVDYTATNGRRVHYIDISAVLAPGWPIGNINETLTVETNHPDYKTIVLPVKGFVSGPIKISPGIVLLTGTKRGDKFTRTITLESKEEMVIGEFSSSSKTMKIDYIGDSHGKKIELCISDIVPLQDKTGAEGLYWEALYVNFLKPVRYRQAIRVWGPLLDTNQLSKNYYKIDTLRDRNEPPKSETFPVNQKSHLVPDASLNKIKSRIASASNMSDSLKACIKFIKDNNGKWPEDFNALSKYGFNIQQVTEKGFVKDKIRYVYLKPSPSDNSIPEQTVVLYEEYNDFADGINVGFADGHIRFVDNEGMFLGILSKTTNRPK